jgi:hypothetical protein
MVLFLNKDRDFNTTFFKYFQANRQNMLIYFMSNESIAHSSSKVKNVTFFEQLHTTAHYVRMPHHEQFPSPEERTLDQRSAICMKCIKKKQEMSSNDCDYQNRRKYPYPKG